MSSTSRPIRKKSKLSDEFSENRVALVIGNGAYNESPLRNPVNDAKAMANVLKEVNFEVNLLTDANRKQMRAAIRKFGENLQKGGVGLFYFAGHGVQVNGKNYLIPVSAEIHDEYDVDDEAVNVGIVLSRMDKAKNRVNILILDACRSNPYERSFRSMNRGLAMIDAPSGTLIEYSTAPGMVADDGTETNSPYTRELINFIPIEGMEVERMFKKVRSAVIEITEGRQVPWESSSLVGDFFFYPVQSPNNRMDPFKQMLKEEGYYHSSLNPTGRGIRHQYTLKTIKNDKVILDATTGLMWQQSGSKESVNYKKAIAYIDQLNNGKFAGYADWHLPNLAEAMTLMEPEKNIHNLHIDSLFDKIQCYIWSSPSFRPLASWIVDFSSGNHRRSDNRVYVRAVRSIQSSTMSGSQNEQIELNDIPSHAYPTAELKPIKKIPVISLRSTPKDNLSINDVKYMLNEKGFYDKNFNNNGEGIHRNYKKETINNDEVVIPEITGQMWQSSGSSAPMSYDETKAYIDKLNREKYAGFSDWHLPTLEEAMSLITPEKQDYGLHIIRLFNKTQWWIWTSDQPRTTSAWFVDFSSGGCFSFDLSYNIYVRAVRSIQSSQ